MVAFLFALDGKNQLREHAMDIRRMVLGLRPEYRSFGDECHLARIAAFGRYAEIDVADNACAVEPAEVQRGDAVFQLFFAYGCALSHGWIISKS